MVSFLEKWRSSFDFRWQERPSGLNEEVRREICKWPPLISLLIEEPAKQLRAWHESLNVTRRQPGGQSDLIGMNESEALNDFDMFTTQLKNIKLSSSWMQRSMPNGKKENVHSNICGIFWKFRHEIIVLKIGFWCGVIGEWLSETRQNFKIVCCLILVRRSAQKFPNEAHIGRISKPWNNEIYFKLIASSICQPFCKNDSKKRRPFFANHGESKTYVQ